MKIGEFMGYKQLHEDTNYSDVDVIIEGDTVRIRCGDDTVITIGYIERAFGYFLRVPHRHSEFWSYAKERFPVIVSIAYDTYYADIDCACPEFTLRSELIKWINDVKSYIVAAYNDFF